MYGDNFGAVNTVLRICTLQRIVKGLHGCAESGTSALRLQYSGSTLRGVGFESARCTRETVKNAVQGRAKY